MIHKTTRSILSVLLAALLLVTSTPLTPAFADGGGVSLQSANNESRELEQVNGEYQIYTADDLKEFAAIVNGTAEGIDQNTSANAKLMNDIDLTSVCSEEEGVSWTPIGNSYNNAYTGTFNGDGHTISGLYINRSADYQGLFGYLSTDSDNTGTVQNLSVSGSVKGNDYVGGIAGQNNGNVINCAFSGSVSGNSSVGGVVGYNSSSGTVKNCYNTGAVSGSGNYVGGVVGYNGGTVENCYNTGAVNSSSNQVGGVVGYNDLGASVDNCYNTGAVNSSGNRVGGVVGYNVSTVKNCYNTGAVSGNRYVGGVVGDNDGGRVENCYNTGEVSGLDSGSGNSVGGVVGWNDNGTVTNCYNTGKVTGSSDYSYIGGVVGDNSGSGTVTGCYFLQENGVPANGIGNGSGSATGLTADQFKNQNSFISWEFGIADTDTWTISENLSRPVLTSNHEGDGTQAHPYRISTATQLENFRDIVNGANNQTADPDAHAKLMNNIDLSSVCSADKGSWNPIGTSSKPYTGTFDGNGHKIENLYINTTDSRADNQGLFGYVGSSGKVQNLSVSGSVSVSHGENVGGIVGYNFSGTVTNCAFSGSVGGIFSCSYVGGIVGYNSSGTVTNCAFSGSVSGNYVGGVVGYNDGDRVTNCYNTGSVKGSGNSVGGVVGDNRGTVKNCYNTGSVTRIDSTYVGGVVGHNGINSSVTNCYFLSGTADNGIGGGSGTSSNVEARTDTAFHSGEVAWRLQAGQADGSSQVWGQSNLKDKNSWPTLVALDKNAKPVYKVAFISDNTEIEAKYANIGMTVDLPEAPKKTNHLFGGWFNNGDLTGDPVTGPISVTGNATYTAKWTPFSYTLSATPSALDFGSITEGEERPAAQTVTVKNTGNQTVTLNPPTAENFEIGALSKTELAPNATASFTIQPKANLSRGSYSEQITISGNDGASATLTATFTVKEPPYTGKYSYEVSTSVGDHGSLTVDRYATEGDKVTITVTPDDAYLLDDLSVTANGKDVELTANSDGTYTFTMPSADVRITATFAEDPDWTEPEEPATDVSDIFLDVAPNAWYRDAVQYAYDNGLMTGVSATEFAPEQTTTRAMIVSILARLEGVTTAQAAGFADVDDNDWYATAVNWAANVGVVNGYEDNTFQPNTAITREQLAAILMNYAAYKGEDVSNRADLTSYTDQPSTWAQEAMQWAVAEGLISGVTADTLQPQGAATRAQVAAILERFLAQ